MTALQSFRRAVGALAGSPVLLVGGVATAAVAAPQTLLSFVGNFGGQPLNGLAGIVGSGLSVLTFFISPLIVAGTLGMAREAIDEGRTSLDTFTRTARDRYVSLLLAFLLRVGLSLVLGILAAVVLFAGLVVLIFVAGFGAGAVTGSGAGGLLESVGAGALAVGGLTLLVAALVFYVPLFFVQFFHVSVATERTGAVEGYKRSFRAVRHNLLSSLGFSVLNFLVGLLPTVPLFGWVGVRLWQRVQSAGLTPTGEFTLLSTTEVVAFTALVLVVQVAVMPFQHTYATAFYGSVSESGPTGGGDTTADPGTAEVSSSTPFETDEIDETDGPDDPATDADDSRWAPDAGDDAGGASDDPRSGDD